VLSTLEVQNFKYIEVESWVGYSTNMLPKIVKPNFDQFLALIFCPSLNPFKFLKEVQTYLYSL